MAKAPHDPSPSEPWQAPAKVKQRALTCPRMKKMMTQLNHLYVKAKANTPIKALKRDPKRALRRAPSRAKARAKAKATANPDIILT